MQETAVTAIVILAVILLGVKSWRAFRRRCSTDKSECGGNCGKCG